MITTTYLVTGSGNSIWGISRTVVRSTGGLCLCGLEYGQIDSA
jgi:hypothetical protein